ncbi:zinc finger protein RFP [Egretta garzetta]|uniref:zinc finger protein RFP n=1 Tax=Egretta garzetta TaxID=188379 RepID=UPI00163CA8F3|nr:zinc finger protein RFP [Egretta garzetta]
MKNQNNRVASAMAAGNAVENLQEETTCAVCLDFFRDPVMLLGCGHNFCRRCLDRCSADAAGAGSCPQCRLPFPSGGFRPNRQLANVVAAVQELARPAAEEFCQRHHQPLSLFCRRDGILLCTACAEHRAHPAVPLEEAARWYRAERRMRMGLPTLTIPQVLSGGGGWLIPSLVATGIPGISRVGASPGEIKLSPCFFQHGEGKFGDFSGLTPPICPPPRCTEWRAQPSLLPMPELEAKLEDFALKTNALAEAVKQFKDILGCSLEEDSGGYRRATVTLDPATAHPQILVSADGRTAGRRESPPAPLPSGSERFESLRCVLGRQGFAGGRHRWAVEVRPGPDWALGVAREFVSRKGCFGLSPERGVWAVGQWLGQLQAFTRASPTSLPHSPVPPCLQGELCSPSRLSTVAEEEEKPPEKAVGKGGSFHLQGPNFEQGPRQNHRLP